jgi:hypothetical protein
MSPSGWLPVVKQTKPAKADVRARMSAIGGIAVTAGGEPDSLLLANSSHATALPQGLSAPMVQEPYFDLH